MSHLRRGISDRTQWIRKHPYSFILLLLQIGVLLVFTAGCFGEAFSVRLTADDLYEGEGIIEYSEDGEGIGVYGAYNAGAYYEILSTDFYTLRPGAYDITVEYSVTLDETLPDESQPDAIGLVSLTSDSSDFMLWDGDMYLVDWRTSQTQRLWVTFPHRAENVELAVHYQATGDLFIRAVTIQELPVWRLSRLLTWLFLFALLDGCLWLLFRPGRLRKVDRVSLLVGVLSVGFASLLAINEKIVLNDDIYYHLGRIVFMSDSLFGGQFPVRMHFNSLNGFGYPSSLFYGEVFLTLPAVLYRMAYPLQACYQAYMVAVNALTYWIAYYSFKKISQNLRAASVGAALYTLAAYRLTCLYERAAVGEYTAMAFLPLIAYGLWQLYAAKDDARLTILHYGPLVAGLTGILQSNLLTTMMSAVMIFSFCLLLLPKTLKPRRLLALCKVVGWTLLLNLWFLWPLVDSMSMPLAINESAAAQAIGSRALDPVYLLGGLSQGYDTYDGILNDAFVLGIALAIGLSLYLFSIVKREAWSLTGEPHYRAAGAAFVLACLSLWLTSSYFPWNAVAALGGKAAYYFCSIQFPWRYLSYASMLAAAVVVLVLTAWVNRQRQTWAYIVSAILLALAVAFAGTQMAQVPARMNYQTYYSSLPQNAVNVSIGEYKLEGSHPYADIPKNVCSTDSAEITIGQYEVTGNLACLTVSNAGEEAAVQIPRYHYDNYHAYDQQSGEELTLATGEYNVIEVLIPAGYEGTVVLRYSSPVSWRIAEIVSLLSLLLLLAAYRKMKRRKETP